MKLFFSFSWFFRTWECYGDLFDWSQTKFLTILYVLLVFVFDFFVLRTCRLRG